MNIPLDNKSDLAEFLNSSQCHRIKALLLSIPRVGPSQKTDTEKSCDNESCTANKPVSFCCQCQL